MTQISLFFNAFRVRDVTPHKTWKNWILRLWHRKDERISDLKQEWGWARPLQ